LGGMKVSWSQLNALEALLAREISRARFSSFS
jgi:hypothetical protein